MIKENGNGKPLVGRVALVTGAGRGIGRAIALELSRRGAAVAANYRSCAVAVERLAGEIRQAGGECMVLAGDVSDKEAARLVVAEVVDRWRRLDILVNNAGITRDSSHRKAAHDEWADYININLNGTYHCTSAALPYMMEQRFGRIINITSLVNQGGAQGPANHPASKGGVLAFTRAVALEMAKYNITANCITPGYTCTEMAEDIPAEVVEALKARIPLGRLGTPAEIGKAAAFLAADADYMTGQQLSVSGGVFMG